MSSNFHIYYNVRCRTELYLSTKVTGIFLQPSDTESIQGYPHNTNRDQEHGEISPR